MTARQRSGGEEDREISALWSPDFSQDQAATDSVLAQTDLRIPTHGETKSSFQDSDEFRNLISQLNQTLENLKYQDKIYKRGENKVFSFRNHSFFVFYFLEKQTYEDNNELKSSTPILEEEPETVYVNIWNADNGELKLSDQTSLFVDQLESIQQERQQNQATPTRVLWRPEYSEAVGGVGNSNQGDPPAPPSFVNNFYQNLRDNPDQELFQFVSNPQASLSVLSLRLTDPGLWQIQESNAVLVNQRKFGKFGSTSRRPGLETPLSLASLMMSEAGAESNPSSLPPYSWGPREHTESIKPFYDDTKTNQQVRRKVISVREGRQVYFGSQVENSRLNPLPTGYIYEQHSGIFLN